MKVGAGASVTGLNDLGVRARSLNAKQCVSPTRMNARRTAATSPTHVTVGDPWVKGLSSR